MQVLGFHSERGFLLIKIVNFYLNTILAFKTHANKNGALTSSWGLYLLMEDMSSKLRIKLDF